MSTENLISIDTFCASHNIEFAFVISLKQSGLIEVVTIENRGFIDTDQLAELEKYRRLYYELNINIEGIETIKHLLLRMEKQHQEIIGLKNRLRLYENNSK